MDSTLIYATLLYLIGFRLLVILLGGMSIYLGYRLFAQAMGKSRKTADNATGADMEAQFGEYNRLNLKNAAPGTFFAAFGAAMVIVILAGSPPSFTFKTQNMSLATEHGDVTVADGGAGGDKPAATDGKNITSTEVTVRGDGEVPETAKAAHKLAGEQFNYLLKLEERAVAMDAQNAAYLDSLAGLYFLKGDFAQALQHQEKAAQLAPQREDMQKRLVAYRAVTSN